MIKVAIVEDDDDIRQITLDNLKANHIICENLGYRSAEDLFEALKSGILPDVIIMDIGLPGMSGIEAVSLLKVNYPSIQSIMFTVFEHSDIIFKALKAGASGYLLKSCLPDKLIEGIRDVYIGGSPMSASIARLVVESFTKIKSSHSTISEREFDILTSLRKGYSYQEVSNEHDISIHTVRSHIRSIYEKLQVNSRTEAVNKVFTKR